MMRLVLISVSACVFIYLIHSYNNSNNLEQENFFADENVVENEGINENTQDVESILNNNEQVGDVQASQGDGDSNETFKTVQEEPEVGTDSETETGNKLPNECYPKDVLSPQDLLPQDANSAWAQASPGGQGSLGDQNFLNAGFHVGINTVGQSLRNSNLQLRSEPANPQLKVSPWLQSTIEPDANRRALEIGA